ncbi:hypothetical protein KS4_35220 [Poriferisphaera corsica]|uniref:DUF4440 domain-containing protein n=1 Tax=Poriferisphaera corsica TaxID=2528020 RepID=A0A517YYY5_9BACT|nr:hypothetical protein [Poriferisphaera corsica]QDU35441.1 hypothetical protein KS4_35220 [Poriferisphaera corsica]
MLTTLSVTVKTMFLENPWPLAASMGVCGFAFLVMASRQGNKRYLSTGITAFILAAITITMAYVVTTPREIILNNTRLLVAATSPLEMKQVDHYIDPYAVLYGPNKTAWLTYDQIQNILPTVVSKHSIKEQSIRLLNAQETNDNTVVAWFGLSSKIAQGFPVRTDWQLVWTRLPDNQWKVIEIHFLKFQGKSPTDGIWNQ